MKLPSLTPSRGRGRHTPGAPQVPGVSLVSKAKASASPGNGAGRTQSGWGREKGGHPRGPLPSETSVPDGPAHLSPKRILLLAVGFGLWAGFVETLPVLVSLYGGQMIRVSRDFLWMTPLADTILFVLVGSVLSAVGGLSPRARDRSVVMGVFAGIATLAVGFSPERLYPGAILLLATGVGVQVSRRTRGPARNPRALGISVGIAFLLVAVSVTRVELRDRSVFHYWHDRLPAPKAEAPNVLLLILDTVRGASLDFLGDLRPQNPRWVRSRHPPLRSWQPGPSFSRKPLLSLSVDPAIPREHVHGPLVKPSFGAGLPRY